MKKLRNYRILLTICACFFYPLQAQSYTDIAGTINSFSKVTSVSGTDVLVDNQIFAAGDVVLLIQMKGAAFRANGTDVTWGSRTFYRDAGHYEFLVVDEVIGNLVRFTRNVIRTYVVSDFVQLVKVPVYENARIAGTLSTNPWNGNTGGILAFVVKDELLFDADIDVKHSGFRGAETVPLDIDDCPIGSNDFAFSSSFLKAGNKGEGLGLYWTLPPDVNINPVNNDFARGRGSIINAGGGGNGRYAGGGGGGNFGKGSTGGYPDERCVGVNSYQAIASYGIGDFFLEGFKGKRLVMGGGGGSGTSGFGRTGGKGGNSGGMVIIIAGKVNGNGKKIIANGQDGGNATGGAGGGGAGGTVALHVNYYINSLDIEIKGGKGGNGNTTTGEKTGPGGGGSGGTLLVKQTALPSSINLQIDRGVAGTPSLFGAFGGDEGGVYTDLKLTLNGFLFFSISEDQLVCQNVPPEELIGTLPIGGSGFYSYLWRTSTNGIDWANAPGPNPINEINYQPPAPVLPGTIFYRRVTSDTSPFPDQIVDDGLPVEIEVLPALSGFNITMDPDPATICAGSTRPLLGNFPVSGGDGVNYAYQWELRKISEADWSSAPGVSNERDYTLGILNDTTYVRRIVVSSVCTATSNVKVVNVHPIIQANTIGDPQTICYNQTPAQLTGTNTPDLEGGDGIYTFLWEVNTGTWQSATGINDLPNYSFPASLTTTTQYQRKVISGACNNVSAALTITVLDSIAGNLLTPVDSLCTDTEIKIGGPVPTAGGNGAYSYSWERRFESTSFGIFVTGGPAADSILTGKLNQDAYFRRTVTSGPCLNVSNEKAVRIDSRPGSLILTGDTLLFFKREFDITASIPDKGVGKWEVVQPTHGYQITNPNAVTTRITNLNIDDIETQHQVEWIVSYLNCADTSSLSITTRGLFKPNAFSPNGDTVNDYLWFFGLENSESNELTVFNRQGNVVFRARNYQVNPDVDLWNGLDFSGNPVRDDTYFFTLTVNNDVPFQGFIILKR